MTDFKKIVELVKEELKEANKEHPLFVDNHQAYAVIREEIEESEEHIQDLAKSLNDLWRNVRCDFRCTIDFANMFDDALHLAAEAIQVAAMCQKAIDSEKAREGK